MNVEFASKEDFEAYRVDAEHQRVIATYIKPIVESSIAMDWEF